MTTPQPPASTPSDPASGAATATTGSPLSTPIWIVIVVVVGLIAAGLTWLITGRSGDDAPTSVTSSNVVGFTIQEATVTLEGQGLTIGDITLEPSDVETGLVLRQNPPAGSSLAPGSPVDLVVAGDANPIVPDVVSLSENEAVNALIAVGLRPGPIEKVESSEPSGRVLAQTPAAGEQVEPGTLVSLRVSSGQVGVDDVVGLTIAEAEAALKNEGFEVRKQEEESDQVGIVLRQDPPAGTDLAPGSVVVLTVGVAAPSPSPSPTPTPTPTPVDKAVCGSQVFTDIINGLRDPADAPLQYLQDYTCTQGWAVVFAAVGDQPDQIVLQRFIFESNDTTWDRVSRDRACSDGSGLPDALREPACERTVS